MVESIFVAEGVYTPAPAGGDPSISFELVNGVDMYGGFPKGGAPFEQRDPSLHPTTLSGDLSTLNSLTVVKAIDLTGVTFDGFIVRDGIDEEGSGGGFEITNQRTWLAASFVGIGRTKIPQLGVALWLDDPFLVGPSKLTDGAGEALWTGTLPNFNQTRSVWLQAMQNQNVSNVVATRVEP